jgi:phage tail-like protein
LDPYKNYKFRLEWDGRYVAGITELTVGLNPAAEAVILGQGADRPRLRKLPGTVRYGAVTLKRGATQDTAFQNWINEVKHFGAALSGDTAAGDPNVAGKLTGVGKVGDVTLKRGVIQDTSLSNWLDKVKHSGGRQGVSPKDLRRDIVLEVYNDAGQLEIAYKLYRCWVSQYLAVANLDRNANAVAIEHIKLENEGWERHLSLPEGSGPRPAHWPTA